MIFLKNKPPIITIEWIIKKSQDYRRHVRCLIVKRFIFFRKLKIKQKIRVSL